SVLERRVGVLGEGAAPLRLLRSARWAIGRRGGSALDARAFGRAAPRSRRTRAVRRVTLAGVRDPRSAKNSAIARKPRQLRTRAFGTPPLRAISTPQCVRSS